MTYPYNYPDNRLIVNNVDLTTEFGLILIDGYTLNPPQPKVYTVDVPGGNGVIDLTEAVGGDVTYNNREQQFIFDMIYPSNFEKTKTLVSNFLHGRYFKYKITMDPDYTYKGRFTISSYMHQAVDRGKLGQIVIDISADPYKYKEDQVYRINGAGGQKYYFLSGRKPVRPVIATTVPISIVFNDVFMKIGVGTHRLNQVLMHEGWNEMYFNTFSIFETKWQDLGKGGEHQMTWEQAKAYTFDQIGRITVKKLDPSDSNAAALAAESKANQIMPLADGNFNTGPVQPEIFFMSAYSWTDVYQMRWQECKDKGWTWEGMNYNPDPTLPGNGGNAESSPDVEIPDLGGAMAVITYEWGDL